MISVGIDVSKDKSTICVIKPYGEIVCSPYEVLHTETQLSELATMLAHFDDEVKVTMEATGIYHLPILGYLKEHEIFVSVINPFLMKKFASCRIRKGKTDQIDARLIANYGIEHWFSLIDYKASDEIYSQLRLLGRQYYHYIKLRVDCKLSLTNLLDRTMPGIKKLIQSNSADFSKDKLNDFVAKYWHFDLITCKSETQFITSYNKWAKQKGYQPNDNKAKQIYALAKDGIPTLSSNTPSTKMLLSEAVRVLIEVDKTLHLILTQMHELAKNLKEYEVVNQMNGVGKKLAPRLIAEIGDVNRFHSSKALIAYAGIDAPPYQSGNFNGTNRHISKRGSSLLRKTGYEVMKSLKITKPEENAVYLFMIKKEKEGKPLKVAKIAALNKFLRVYYAKVKELYN